ncbi:phage scaffolding protein [Paenibacillus humicus]|uniref:phage scaffolding protein n=1 Tax=Paenibacillus humicus TaxID=412861 RepID=UPI0013E2ACD5|nr:scaffolding protein [Paenibacillus humicus]
MINDVKRDLRYKLNLQTFAEDPDTTPEPEPAKKLEMTQEEFDRIIADRIGRERKKFADYDDVKTKLTAFEQAEAERKKAELTDKERADADKAAAMKRAEDAEAERDKALTAANQRLIKAEFKTLAKDAGIRSDALEDAFKLADVSGITVDDEGNVVGAKDVLDALVAAKPYLVEVTKKEPRQIGGASNPDPTDEVKTLEAQLDEARKRRDFNKVVELSNKIKQLAK